MLEMKRCILFGLAVGFASGCLPANDDGAGAPERDEREDGDSGEGKGEGEGEAGGSDGEGEGEGEGDDGLALCCFDNNGTVEAYDCGPSDVPACEAGTTTGCFRNGGRDGECG